jgi:Mrp family chromosome partitioning ATPase
VNDPDQTMRLPVVEVSSESNGTSSRQAFPQKDAVVPPRDTIVPPRDAIVQAKDRIVPPKNTTRTRPTVAADVDPLRFEPTVFGAIRQYRVLILAMGILAMVAAVAYSLHQPKIYQAEANVTVPLPASSQATADPGQYLDSQVLLLQSQGVAEQAAAIANRDLGSNVLAASDFYGNHSSLAVVPPTTASPGGYGASIVAVSFEGTSPQIAQAGLNAVLHAFDAAVSDAISSQANATIAGIDKAIRESTSPDQQAALQTQRTQTLVNEQTDLAQTPTAAVGPTTRANGHWALDGIIGLVAGVLAGTALAYALALRRRKIASRQDPAAMYGVPMIAETPAYKVRGDIPPVAGDPHSAVAEGFRFAAVSVERACTAHEMPLSLAFISPLEGAGKSTIVANLALAMAEGGTRLLVVDGDAADGGVTARLLPGIRVTEGFEQILSGQRGFAECVEPSPYNSAITVLGYAPATQRLVTGAARLRAAQALLAQAKTTFDIVLIDCPALLQVADATELVNAADAAIIVVNPGERIPDHLEMVDWLKQAGPDVIGYLYNRAPVRSHSARHRRGGSAAQLAPKSRPNLIGDLAWDDSSQPSQQPQR